MPACTVIATNWATGSENKIHDDEIASRYGFHGGLVPGVTLYGYIVRLFVETWGEDWIEHGWADVRFVSPVYDGDSTTMSLSGDGRVELFDSSGTVCMTGSAGMFATSASPIDIRGAPLPAERPIANDDSLEVGTVLGSLEQRFNADATSAFLDLIGDHSPVYRAERIAHPGWLILNANTILTANVELGPWIHTASRVQNTGCVRDGSLLSTRAKIADRYERGGHKFIELDVLLLADDKPASSIRHTAIWRIRDHSQGGTDR